MTTTVDLAVGENHEAAVRTPNTPNLTDLVSGILNDAQQLFRQQIELVKAEFKEDLRRTRQVAQCFGLGTAFLTVGGVMLLVASVYLLEALTGLPLWADWAIIGGASAVIGLIAMAIGKSILASYNPLPDKSFHALQENVSCLTNQPK